MHIPNALRREQSASGGSFASQLFGHVQPARYENQGLKPVPMQGESVVEEILPGEPVVEESMAGPHAVEGFGDGCACGGSGCNLCTDYGAWGALSRARQRTEFFQGVSAFSGPINRGGAGSFGFEGGLNMGSALFGGWRGLGVQAGAGGTLTNFNGATFTTDTRGQVFVTAGLFRRVDWGLQGGLVIDHRHDDWYASIDLTQARGELSWVVPEGPEFGFLFATSNDDDVAESVIRATSGLETTADESWHVNDYYAFFVRRTFCNGAEGRVFAGWTGTSDGLLGADLFLPLNEDWSLRNSFTYLLPEEGQLDGGVREESWNVGLQLVWMPHGRGCGKDYYRPLFNVANNGTFFVTQ